MVLGIAVSGAVSGAGRTIYSTGYTYGNSGFLTFVLSLSAVLALEWSMSPYVQRYLRHKPRWHTVYTGPCGTGSLAIPDDQEGPENYFDTAKDSGGIAEEFIFFHGGEEKPPQCPTSPFPCSLCRPISPWKKLFLCWQPEVTAQPSSTSVHMCGASHGQRSWSWSVENNKWALANVTQRESWRKVHPGNHCTEAVYAYEISKHSRVRVLVPYLLYILQSGIKIYILRGCIKSLPASATIWWQSQ